MLISPVVRMRWSLTQLTELTWHLRYTEGDSGAFSVAFLAEVLPQPTLLQSLSLDIVGAQTDPFGGLRGPLSGEERALCPVLSHMVAQSRLPRKRV